MLKKKVKHSNPKDAVLYDIRCCVKCGLWKTRRQVVIGRGSLPADVLLIGEAPGESEDMLGEAFIGRSGKLLDRMLVDALATVNIEITMYMTNTVLCRPCDTKDGANRTPRKPEIESCQHNVMRLIALVNPKFIVYVGDVAERAMKKYFKDFSVTKVVHPAYVLRQGGKTSPYYLHNVRVLADAFEAIATAKEKVYGKENG